MDSGAHSISLRIDLAGGGRIGPGKVALLEAINRCGSISAAGRALGMSYRRAWMLAEALKEALGTPVLEAVAGGSGGGGARLTPAGHAVVRQYRAMEQAAATIVRPNLHALDAVVRPEGSPEKSTGTKSMP